MSKPTWYNIEAKAGESADVMIYDVVGYGPTSADSLVRELKGLKAKTINVHMNTPGGGVFDGIAIYNALKNHPAKVVMHVDGLAASIGSLITMAGDEIRMAKSAFMMIHNPSCFVIGDASDMRKQADLLDKAQGSLAQIYADRTKKPIDEIKSAMAEETWYTAAEAKAAGMCDVITGDDEKGDGPQATALAQFDFKMFALEPTRMHNFVASRLKETPIDSLTAPRGVANPAPPNKDNPTMDIEQFKAFAAAHPDAITPFVTSAVEAAVARAKTDAAPKAATATELKALFPNHSGFIVDQLGANASVDQAKASFADVVAKENTALKAENERLTKLAAETGQDFDGVKIPPKGQGKGGDAKAKFETAVKAKTDGGMSRAKAVAAVVVEQPAIHREYLDAVNTR